MTRLLLVAGCVLLFALALAGMRLGWRHRGARQDWLPELPAVPGTLGAELAAPLAGLYVGTTLATRWQDRIVARGLGVRAAALARLTEAGVLVERQGSSPVFLPADQLVDARLEPALAGKVVGAGGLLVLRWRHGGQDLDSGIRAEDKTGYPAWLAALEHLTAPATSTGSAGHGTRTGTENEAI
ncbi:transporter [Jatrophihabitans sp.]|uniref:PH-like domain-containing protein n=1 Tax=Jatrophihabitans sp. TaxID=1932789 RepID=UPI002CAB6973|nr:transporter [Jatrophihabitans sp.]